MASLRVTAISAVLSKVHAFLPANQTMHAFARAAARSASTAANAGASARAASVAGVGDHARSFSTDRESSVAAPQTLRLDNLRDNPGANKPKRKKGRGVGGGHGLARSAGEGSKGQKSHQGGGIPLGFEGGQSPLWRRTPKFGYMAKGFRREMDTVNLNQLQHWIDTGRINPNMPITIKTLVDAGLANKVMHGVKLLGTGAEDFKAKVHITVSQASASAISAIEAAGGSIVSVYYTDLALRSVIKPHKFPIPIRAPLPTPNIMRYYVKYENRGYLSPEVQLSQVKARLAAGMPAPLATSLHPVFVGGASLDADRHIIDIDVNAPKKVMEAAAQAGAAQPGAGAAKASA